MVESCLCRPTACFYTFNYLIARCLHFLDTTPLAPHRKLLLTLAVGANLGLLAYYKYTGFFLRNLNALAGTHLASDIATCSPTLLQSGGENWARCPVTSALLELRGGHVAEGTVGPDGLLAVRTPLP